MSVQFYLDDFLARSTDKPFSETSLYRVCEGLPPLSEKGPWLAGGSLRRTLQGGEPDSDFDFFFNNEQQLVEFSESLLARGLRKIKETEHHLHFQGAVGDSSLPRDVQCIKFKFYDTAEDVIDSFDFTICQLVYDGLRLICGDYTLWDLARKRLAVHRVTFPVSSMRRVLKYTRQGFTACNGCLATLLRATADNPELRLDIAYVD